MQRLARSVEEFLAAAAPVRAAPPSLPEITAAVQRELLPLRVYFIDGTFEHVGYSLNSTAAEAAAELAHSVGLRASADFSLFAGDAGALMTAGWAGAELTQLPSDACVGDVLLGAYSSAGAVCAEDSVASSGAAPMARGASAALDSAAAKEGGEAAGGAEGDAVRLLFKKRYFRRGDAAAADPVHVALCYAQVRRC